MVRETMNFTVAVPPGTVNHGNPSLICTPPEWYNYAVFYLANYFAHVFTVVTKSGQGILETADAAFFALILPGSGVARAVSTMVRRARLYRKDPLKQALQAEALFLVVRISKWNTQQVEDEEIELESRPWHGNGASDPELEYVIALRD